MYLSNGLLDQGFSFIPSEYYLKSKEERNSLIYLNYLYTTSLQADGPRNRAYLKLLWDRESQAVTAAKSQCYFQTAASNNADGGKARQFAVMDLAILELPVMKSLIENNLNIIEQYEPLMAYEQLTLGLHFIQYLAVQGCASYSSPVGIMTPMDTFQLKNKEVIGVGCALLAGFFYSIATIIAKKISMVPPPMMIFLQLLAGGVILLPLAHLSQIHFTWETSVYILILGIVHTVLAFILYYHSVSKLTTDKIAVLSYVDPMAAIFTDVLFFDRILHPIQILGISITFLGSYFVIDMSVIKKIFMRRIQQAQ